jgi:hypothetical protein
VPGRGGKWTDVAIDCIGIAGVAIACWSLHRFRTMRPKGSPSLSKA